MSYLTPDQPTADSTVWCLTFPDEPGIRELIAGALVGLTRPRYFTQRGSMTPEETAEVFLEIFGTWKECRPLLIGEIVPSGRMFDEEHRLLCDGRSISTSSYPLLFAAIGYRFGGAGSSFSIPDLLGRVPVGASASVGRPNLLVGESTGEENHTLTTGEMPAHTHSIHSHFDLMAQLGAGEPVSVPNLTPAESGSAGSGQSHNNMQPSLGVNYFIVCD